MTSMHTKEEEQAVLTKRNQNNLMIRAKYRYTALCFPEKTVCPSLVLFGGKAIVEFIFGGCGVWMVCWCL